MAWSSALKNHGHEMYWILAKFRPKAKFKLFGIFIPALCIFKLKKVDILMIRDFKKEGVRNFGRKVLI